MSVRGFATNLMKRAAERLGYEVRARRYYFVDPFADQAELLATLPRPLVILDVGANEGQTIEEYRRVFGSGTVVHSFEPTPELFDRLTTRYGEDPLVHVHRLAVSDARGTASFHVIGMSLLNSLLPMAPDRDTYGTGVKEVAEIQVETCTLDSFCESNGLSRVNVLKLDIEGAELKALTGASELLRSQRIDVLFLEVGFSQRYEGAELKALTGASELLRSQ